MTAHFNLDYKEQVCYTKSRRGEQLNRLPKNTKHYNYERVLNYAE